MPREQVEHAAGNSTPVQRRPYLPADHSGRPPTRALRRAGPCCQRSCPEHPTLFSGAFHRARPGSAAATSQGRHAELPQPPVKPSPSRWTSSDSCCSCVELPQPRAGARRDSRVVLLDRAVRNSEMLLLTSVCMSKNAGSAYRYDSYEYRRTYGGSVSTLQLKFSPN